MKLNLLPILNTIHIKIGLTVKASLTINYMRARAHVFEEQALFLESEHFFEWSVYFSVNRVIQSSLLSYVMVTTVATCVFTVITNNINKNSNINFILDL